MPAIIRSAGVAPEMNMKNPLNADTEACKRGIHSGFETQGKSHQKFKTGVSSGPTKRTDVLQILKEKELLHYALPSKQKETNLNCIGRGRVDLELSSQV